MKWEYRIIFVECTEDRKTGDAERTLNEFGRNGWELVTASREDTHNNVQVLFLKRQL